MTLEIDLFRDKGSNKIAQAGSRGRNLSLTTKPSKAWSNLPQVFNPNMFIMSQRSNRYSMSAIFPVSSASCIAVSPI